jgi:hypothetical protein
MSGLLSSRTADGDKTHHFSVFWDGIALFVSSGNRLKDDSCKVDEHFQFSRVVDCLLPVRVTPTNEDHAAWHDLEKT